VKIIDVRRDMLVVGPDGRRYRAVDRELSPIGQGVRHPWLRMHLQDLESGAVSVVECRGIEEVEAEWPPEMKTAEPGAADVTLNAHRGR